MKKIPVGATIAHAYRFVFGDFFKILGVMWLPMAIMWLPGILLRPRLTALSAQMAAQDFSGLREIWPFLVPFYLVALVLVFMQIIGIAQLALGGEKGSTWFYFSLAKPVWRLIGSFLLLIVALVVGWLAIVLGGILVGYLLGLASKLVSNSVFGVITAILAGLTFIILWCGYFYSLVRLTFLLTPVVAAKDEGFALARSWTLGLGNFWRMFAVLLIIFLPFLILECVFLFGYMFKGLSFPPPHAPAAQTAAFQAAMNARTLEMMNVLHQYWYITYPVSIAIIVVFYGLSVGAQCFGYRALIEGETSAPVAAD